MVPGAALRQALEGAYTAFAPYQRPAVMAASPLRDPVAILRRLTRAPLHEVAGEDIGPYAGWAMTTVGDTDDYKHFLPRILEIAVESGSWMGTHPEIVASRLERAGWRDWPAAEQHAVVAVFAAAFEQASLAHPDYGDASQWLCGLATMGEPVEPPLHAWAARRTVDSALHVASFVRSVPDLTEPPTDEDAFWADVDPKTRLVIAAWIGGREVADALAWLEGRIEPDDAWLLEQADEVLTQRRRH